MKRMWIGVGLLAAVLISGIWVAGQMREIHQEMAKDLNRAAACVLDEDWDMATALAARAEKDWSKKRPLTASFADHEPLEDIDALFAQLAVYSRLRDKAAYSSICADLASQLEALGESHRFTFWNLL